MELSHTFTVPASVDVAWATFMDLERVGGCFPGAVVTEVTDDGFSGTVKVKLGPIALQYAGSGSFTERDDTAHRAVIEAKGKDKRGNGTAGATVTIQLTPDGSSTRADVSTDLAVTGKPAQFGRGIMQDVSDKLLQQFVTCIERQFDARPPAEAASDLAGGAAEPAGAGTTDADAAAVLGGSSAANGTNPADAAKPASAPPTIEVGPGTAAPTRPAVSRDDSGTDDALDLGATVVPVLLKTYAPYAVAGLAGVLLGILIGRRRAH